MKFLSSRSTFLTSAALTVFAHSPALATVAVAPEDRDYLPTTIVVTGEIEGYVEDDGSTGTKTPTPLIEVPQTITFITDDQLDDQAITQLADALRYVPGISLDTGEGHRDQVYIRGQASTADFYLDGLRDDAQYYRPLYNVERIEILKGANALIFGRGGGGGVINRVSKKAEFDNADVGLGASVDSFGAFDLSIDANTPLNDNIAGRINVAYEEFDNARDFYDGRFFGISPTLTFRLGDRTQLTAHYTYDNDRRVTDRGIPSLDQAPLAGYDKTFFGSADFNLATNVAHIAKLRLDHEFTDELTLNVSGQYADYDKYYGNVVPTGTDGTNVTLGGYTSNTDRQNWIGQANLVWDTQFGGVGSTTLAGVEVSTQDTVASRNGIEFDGSSTVTLQRVLDVPNVSVGALTRASNSTLDTFSAYVQEQLDFGLVELIGGIRYDRFDLTDLLSATRNNRVDEKWSPRFGAVLKPAQNLSIYASYSTSFLPQSGDQFSSLSDLDATLEPEKFENIEAGIKWAPRPQLFATAAVFQLERSNTTAEDPLNPGFIVLTGKSRVRGFEASIAGEILPSWQANLGYTYLDGEIISDTESAVAGTRLHQLPKHQIALWNRVDLTESFGIGLGAIYQDEQFASISGDVVLPDYVRFDLAGYWDVNDRISMQVNIENLLDENYYPSAHGNNNIQPGNPLSATVGVKLKL
ncbi:Ferrichrome-iron receptor [Altererythrobacter epoxidivorans]|uniref:Ferrichrome-iron receptor n=1 Tax=Altererythrobacter epoxidivorans TaxID=361183 RepID=A0A0M5KZU3_9SPHN|nr:TonB-dependent siderophore receptor [Altererythrobacter epoxidivorans]ALE17349.1 Ferrichrome-iron receptor [Altererythrobacter epoxidivorans]